MHVIFIITALEIQLKFLKPQSQPPPNEKWDLNIVIEQGREPKRRCTCARETFGVHTEGQRHRT